jgi:hypothetical protein
MNFTHIIKELFTGKFFKVYRLQNIKGNIWRTKEGKFVEEREIESIRIISK